MRSKSIGERIVENGGVVRLKRISAKVPSGSIFAKDRGKEKSVVIVAFCFRSAVFHLMHFLIIIYGGFRLDLEHLLTSKKKGANRFRTVAKVFVMNHVSQGSFCVLKQLRRLHLTHEIMYAMCAVTLFGVVIAYNNKASAACKEAEGDETAIG